MFFDFVSDFGGIPDDVSYAACEHNTNLLNTILQYHAINNTIIVAPTNTTIHMYCNIYGKHVNNTILQIDGTIRFEKKPHGISKQKDDNDPSHHYEKPSHPNPCFMIDRSDNVTITSKHGSKISNYRGIIDGRGSNYWGIPLIGYLEIQEIRPRLVRINQTSNLLIENMIFQDSPYHTIYLENVRNVTIRYSSIVARRTKYDGHTLLDLTAFNTDGIDVSGTNVHIHDIDIWNQDDCIAVKDNYYTGISQHMVFENINASGVGFVIGSIGNSTVHNITFRNSYLHKPVKGIYMKFNNDYGPIITNGHGGIITNISYDNITIYQPSQWSIWIGPAQQSDSKRLCHANPCSLCWPNIPNSHCNVVKDSYFRNITLKDITIIQPQMSPGVILGDDDDSQQRSNYNNINNNNNQRYFDGKQNDDHNHHHSDVVFGDSYNDMTAISSTNARIDGIVFHNVQVIKNDNNKKWSSLFNNNRYETFPGLQQPIIDHYIPNHIMNQYHNPGVQHTIGILGIIIVFFFIRKIMTSRMKKWYNSCSSWCCTRWTKNKQSSHIIHCDENCNNDENIHSIDDTNKNCEELREPLLLQQEKDQQLGNNDDALLLQQPKRDEERLLKQNDKGNSSNVGIISVDQSSLLLHCAEDNDIQGDDRSQHLLVDQPEIPKKVVTKSFRRNVVLFLQYFIIVFLLINTVLWMILPALLPRDRFVLMSNYVQRKLVGTNAHWDNTNHYYRCTGVVKGIASGDTWPVPPCFQDVTTHTEMIVSTTKT